MPHIHYCPQQHCCTANYSIFPRVWTHKWYFQIKHFASLLDFELFCCTGAASYYNSAIGLSNRPFLFFAAWALCQCLLHALCVALRSSSFIYVLFQVPHPVDLNSVRAAVMLTAIEATAARSSNARSQAATFAPISVFDLFESLWEVEPALQLYSSVLQIFTGLQKDLSYSFLHLF